MVVIKKANMIHHELVLEIFFIKVKANQSLGTYLLKRKFIGTTVFRATLISARTVQPGGTTLEDQLKMTAGVLPFFVG